MKATAGRKRAEESGIRERILEAAMAGLQKDGIRGLSQVQVARRAKVRQSHLTYYFAKRQDLIEAIAERFFEGVAHGLEEVVTAGAAAGDVGPLVQRLAAVIIDPRHMRMFLAMIVEADTDATVRAILVRLTARLQSLLAAGLGGSDAAERAANVIANLWGLGLYDFVLRPKRPGARAASYIASMRTGRDART